MKSFFKKLAKKLKQLSLWEAAVLIGVVLLIVFIIKFFGKSKTTEVVRLEVTGRQWWADYNVNDPPNWLINALSVGDKEKAPDGSVSAEILKIDAYQQGSERYKIYLLVRLTGILDKKTGHFNYKGKPVLVGELIGIVFPKVKISGMVTHIGGDSNLEKQRFKARLRWRTKDPWIVKNTKMKSRAWNFGNDEPIAEILSVETEMPSSDIFLGSAGSNVFVVKDPKKRDILMDIWLTAEKDGGVWVYAGRQKIKIGERLWIYTDNLDIEGTEIMSLEPINE